MIKMKQTPIIPIKWIHDQHDTDQDGVPNYRDCDPWNPRYHGIRPNLAMRKRIEKLPIYVTDESFRTETSKRFEMPSKDWKGIYPMMSKKAKKYAPHARKQLLSTIKKYPSVVGEVERRQPKILLYSSQTIPEEEEEATGLEMEEKVLVKPTQIIYRSKKSMKREIETKAPKREIQRARREYLEESPYMYEETIGEIGRKQRRHIAGTIFHELMHVKQEKLMGEKGMKRQREKYEYTKRPIEMEAEMYARKKLKEIERKTKHLFSE